MTTRTICSIAAAIAGILLSLPASAATFTLDATLPAPSGPVTAATSTSGAVTENVTDSVSGVRRSPWQSTIHDGALYTSVSGNSSATYEFSGLQAALEIMWGSVDAYNDIDFYAGGVLIDTINGAALIADGAPNQIGYIVATIFPIAGFDAIVIRSAQNAFEFAELTSTAVPLPGAAALLFSGLGGLAFASRKRKTA